MAQPSRWRSQPGPRTLQARRANVDRPRRIDPPLDGTPWQLSRQVTRSRTNPEVAGSNPAPATANRGEGGALVFGSQSRRRDFALDSTPKAVGRVSCRTKRAARCRQPDALPANANVVTAQERARRGIFPHDDRLPAVRDPLGAQRRGNASRGVRARGGPRLPAGAGVQAGRDLLLRKRRSCVARCRLPRGATANPALGGRGHVSRNGSFWPRAGRRRRAPTTRGSRHADWFPSPSA